MKNIRKRDTLLENIMNNEDNFIYSSLDRGSDVNTRMSYSSKEQMSSSKKSARKIERSKENLMTVS